MLGRDGWTPRIKIRSIRTLSTGAPRALCYASCVLTTKPIALVGLMGAGKSSVAYALGVLLGVKVADLDARIAAIAGSSIAELFACGGEAAFRQQEIEALRQAIDEPVGIIACGGGVILEASNRALLRERCRTVWLEVSAAEATRRVAGSPGTRPMLGAGPLEARLAALHGEREAAYAEVAVARVDTTGQDLESVIRSVVELLDLEVT